MKTSFWDRMLMFLYVLIALAFALCMALRPFGVDAFGALFGALEGAAGGFIAAVIGLGLAAIVALLSAYMLMMIFRKGRRHASASFITVNSGDGGQVRIALSALAQMARRAVGRVDGVREMKIDVSGDDKGVEVSVALTMDALAHVPTVTTNMQRAIRNRIESNCGVAVRDVEVTVSALTAEDEAQAKKTVWPRRRRREEATAAAAAQEAAAPVAEAPEAETPAPENADAWQPAVPAEAEADAGRIAPVETEMPVCDADGEDDEACDADLAGPFILDDEDEDDEDCADGGAETQEMEKDDIAHCGGKN
ncbi:MAG TPA: alkaline shock response membrane anchor protein AmaP [Candidatus Pullichristensenella avicola]|nr:alkaline shock response membrane anchor protein AmaP [Candidatus Pullichristensenella avicola]